MEKKNINSPPPEKKNKSISNKGNNTNSCKINRLENRKNKEKLMKPKTYHMRKIN